MTPAEYLRALDDPAGPHGVDASGLCGRVLRGRSEADFERLSDDPERPVVMLTDSGGLASLVGRSDAEKLRVIGYTADYITGLLATGHRFRLVVLPESVAVPATWDEVLRLTERILPETAAAVAAHGPALRTTSFEEIEAAAGYRFRDADDPRDPRYMDGGAFARSGRGLVELRALLYHRLYLRELFAGDGYTYDGDGNRGVREYLAPNLRIADIPGAAVRDLEVTLP